MANTVFFSVLVSQRLLLEVVEGFLIWFWILITEHVVEFEKFALKYF